MKSSLMDTVRQSADYGEQEQEHPVYEDIVY